MKTATLLTAVLLSLVLNHQALGQTVEVNQTAIKTVVQDWNNAHNSRDIHKLEELYASKLTFYGLRLAEDKCLRKKTELFDLYPDFHQEIVSEALNLTAYSSGKIKCEFTKEVTFNHTTKQYPSYLLLENTAGTYFIAGESDYITDKNLKYHPKLGQQVKIVNTDKEQEMTQTTETTGDGILHYLLQIAALVVIFYVLKKLWDVKIWNLMGDRRKYYRQMRTQISEPLPGRPQRYQREHQSRTVVVETETMRISVATQNNSVYEGMGRQFEEYTVQKFDRRYFTLLEWRSDKIINGIYAESNRYPDLHFEFKMGPYYTQFAVECKFRSKFIDGQISIAREDQLDKYREFQASREVRVYIFIGVGGTPQAPHEGFLIPLDQLHDPVAKRSYLENFRKDIKHTNFFFNRDTHSLT